MEWMKLVHGEMNPAPPAVFKPGDEVRVWYRIMEQGSKERLGQFEGIVIRYRGAGPAKTFTVRRVTHGEGVERVFPVDAKAIARIEVLRQGKVKRGRLYYLRGIIGKTRIQAADGGAAEPSVSAATVAGERPSAVEKPESAVPS